jgi:hypothetical protein
MVSVSALSDTAQEESDEQYIEGHTKADPPDEDDSLPGAGARSRTRVPA